MASTGTDLKTNQQWMLAARPMGRAKETDFEWRKEALPELADGQILVRNIYLSLDPTNRVWMDPIETYLPMLQLGSVMRGICLGIVEASHSPRFAAGDLVQGMGGWQNYYAGDAHGWSKLPRVPGLPLTAWLGAMGHIGFTAYFGLFDIGQPKPGETLVVTGAAGAVGSLVGQMGKIAGCRVVGVAGSDEKCAWITGELGFDAAIYVARYSEAAAKIIGWIQEGKLRYRIDMVEGLRAAPAALNRLFDGANMGKLLVKVSEQAG